MLETAHRPEGAQERDHLPPYYSALRELVTRLMRRPNHMQTALRQAEAASALAAARQRVDLPTAFGNEFDDIAAKLVADVCGFLVSAAGLDPEFRVQARAYLLAEHKDKETEVAQKAPAKRAAVTAVPENEREADESADVEKVAGQQTLDI